VGHYAFSWTCVPTCSAAVLAKAIGSWTRIFYSATLSDATPQHLPDSYYWESECSEDSSHPPPTAASTPAPTRGANSVSVAARQNYVRRKVNHVTVEEAQEAPDVVIGTFFVNEISAVVLFDSRASHSFISTAYVNKHNLPIVLLRCQMIVSSPGGDMPARQLCPKVNLKIRG
jgi:hypothetical protein